LAEFLEGKKSRNPLISSREIFVIKITKMVEENFFQLDTSPEGALKRLWSIPESVPP
jgi:hypothetical protein